MELNLFCREWGTKYYISFFHKKFHAGWMKAKKLVFQLPFSQYGFSKEKTSKQYLVPHFPPKWFYSFLSSDVPFPKKLFFTVIFEKYILFFLKKLFNEKYSIPHFLQKWFYWFLSSDTPFPSKWSCPPTNGFSQFFLKIGFINFVFITDLWKQS